MQQVYYADCNMLSPAHCHQVYSSDMCCSDKEVVQETLGSGSKQTGASKSSPGGGSTRTVLPLLAFPVQEKNPVYIAVAQKKFILSMHACDQALQRARDTTTLVASGASVAVLGFDCEWEVHVSGRRKVATVQLSALVQQLLPPLE